MLTVKLHETFTTKSQFKNLHTWKLKHTCNKHWAKEETKMKIINYLEINNGNIIYQSTQRKTYSLKCIYFKNNNNNEWVF